MKDTIQFVINEIANKYALFAILYVLVIPGIIFCLIPVLLTIVSYICLALVSLFAVCAVSAILEAEAEEREAQKEAIALKGDEAKAEVVFLNWQEETRKDDRA